MGDHMTAPDRIRQLVETFEQNIHEYHSRKNETELRRQFLDPFFEALGWDVFNKQRINHFSMEGLLYLTHLTQNCFPTPKGSHDHSFEMHKTPTPKGCHSCKIYAIPSGFCALVR